MASGGRSLSSETKFHKVEKEIERQNEYLAKNGRKRNEVEPDENCFFRAVHASGQHRIPNVITDYHDHVELRKEAIEYILDRMADFRVLFPGEGMGRKREIRQELKTIKHQDIWAGYESVMAISLLLEVRVLVTCGGSVENPDVITMAYYFGEKAPENYIHIAWVSLGYYDAVVLQDEKKKTRVNTFSYINKHYQSDGLVYIMNRHPFHICQCQKASRCQCANYQTIAKELGTKIKKDYRSERTDTTSRRTKATSQSNDMPTYFINHYQGELESQDEYLQSRGLCRVAVQPDANSFLCALAICLNASKVEPTTIRPLEHQELRKTVVNEIEDNAGLYRPLFQNLTSGRAEAVHKACESLEKEDTWVGYECLMAATKALKRRVLVTYGGYADCPDVITTGFYFGDPPPAVASLHIAWLSLGYYDAVLPKEATDSPSGPRGVNTFKEMANYTRTDFSSRPPVHACRCGANSSCRCRRYRSSVSEADLNPDTRKTTEAEDVTLHFEKDVWPDIFHDLSKEGLVLEKWRMLLLNRLRLPQGDFVEIEQRRDLRIAEKLDQGLRMWLRNPTKLTTFRKLIEALRKENLNMCADKLVAKYEKRFANN